MHTSKGLLEFKPTSISLHVLYLKEHPNAAHVLVTAATAPDAHLQVNTVRDNFDGFTKKQIQRTQEARRLMLMTGVPSERAFQSMVPLNQLKNCPITHDDINVAHMIEGCDLANTRGKMVRHKLERVDMDYVEIPQELLLFHCNVTLVADVMFVNSVPFHVLALRSINLIIIEPAPKRTTSKLGHLLQCIVNVFARAGFHLRTILMDNEFEKVRDHVSTVNMNTPAVAEHTVDIERHIRMIKECCCFKFCTLPYKTLPQQILIHLLHFVVMWLNNFPSATGISSTFSPCELIL